MSLPRFIYIVVVVLQTSLAGPLKVVGAASLNISMIGLDFPICATACIQHLISSFPRCSWRRAIGIECLCRNKSASSLTLGEGALQCLFSSCSPPEADEGSAIMYDVCSDVANAQIPTHTMLSASIASPTTLTVTIQPNTRITKTTAKTHNSYSSPTPLHTSVPNFSGSIILDTEIPNTRPTYTPSFSGTFGVLNSPVSTAMTVSPVSKVVAAAPTGSVLTEGQVAGISVAGSLVVIAAISLTVLLLCLRTKNSNRRDSDVPSFGISGGRPYLGDNKSPFFLRLGSESVAGETCIQKPKPLVGVPRGPAVRRWKLWRHAKSKQHYQGHSHIGLAISSEISNVTNQDSSPASGQSYRTESRLLPDKPVLQAPDILRTMRFGGPSYLENTTAVHLARRQSFPVVISTPAPMPEKNGQRLWSEEHISHPTLQSIPPHTYLQLRHQSSDPFIDKPKDIKTKPFVITCQKTPNEDPQRVITIRDGNRPPGQESRINSVSEPDTFPPHIASLVPQPLNSTSVPQLQPSPLLPSPFIHSNRHHYRGQQETFSSNQLQLFATTQFIESLIPSHRSMQTSKHLPRSLLTRTYVKRPETHYSDTSFEDGSEGSQQTYERRASTLSSVFESLTPAIAMPISHVPYPQVPGSVSNKNA